MQLIELKNQNELIEKLNKMYPTFVSGMKGYWIYQDGWWFIADKWHELSKERQSMYNTNYTVVKVQRINKEWKLILCN